VIVTEERFLPPVFPVNGIDTDVPLTTVTVPIVGV
jgi:hypothetical protein